MRKIEKRECLNGFGDFIRTCRTQKDLLQQEVADSAGISQSYYSLIERGEREVDLVLAMQLCNVLGLDLRKFIEEYM